jgi:hypothetical protein
MLKTALLLCTWFGFVAGQDTAKKTTFSGWAWLTVGRVEQSLSESAAGVSDLEFEKEWLDNFEAGFKVVSNISDHVRARMHFMASLQYPVIRNRNNLSTAEPLIRRFSLTILDAAFQGTWGIRGDADTICVEFGYLPVKYNPQSTNLGEYLFRSGTYPGYLVSGFELSDKVKLTGLHLGYTRGVGGGSAKADVYFTNDMDVYPVHDFSLALIAGACTPRRLVDFAAGVSFAHLITVDDRKTTPGTDKQAYPRGNDPHVSFIDSVTHDTTWLTFRGTKLMSRLTIDPKALFPWRHFGDEDLKLYGEAALLGAKSYPGWYANIKERVPVMGGINVPTFKLLDILSIEVEWYGLKYWNTPEFVWREFTPRPYTGNSTRVTDYYSWADSLSKNAKTDDDWRWSLYASRKIGKSFRVSAQVASDHMSRLPWAPTLLPKYTEICNRTRDWYWMTRVMFYF